MIEEEKRKREELLIQAFITPARRERYRTLLSKSATRTKITNRLNHHVDDLDLRFRSSIPAGSSLAELAASLGGSGDGYLISSDPELDQLVLPLDDALEEAEWGNWGTIIDCVPGKLAYYRGENGENRTILLRSNRS